MSKDLIGTNEFTSDEWDKIPFPARQQLGDHGQLRDARSGRGISDFAGEDPKNLVHAEPFRNDSVRRVDYHLESTPPPAEPKGAPGSESYARHRGHVTESDMTLTSQGNAVTARHNPNAPVNTQRNTGENVNDRIMGVYEQGSESSSAPAVAGGTPDATTEPVPGDTDGDGVPNGSVSEVMAWVGDDSGRARQALESEQKRSQPRSSLITQLNDRI